MRKCNPRISFLLPSSRSAIRYAVPMAQNKATANSMKIRVLSSKKGQRILYAEAGKDFVDLLFSFLLLPAGTVVKVLSDSELCNSVGCITNLYDSIDKLPSALVTGKKSDLLQPKIASGSASKILPIESAAPVSPSYYVCANHGSGYCSGCRSRYAGSVQHSVSLQSGQTCTCGQPMQTEVKLVAPPSAPTTSGYVKETFSFIITDDLIIMPSSAIASIALLQRLRVKDLNDLEERILTVGFDEALNLLRASLVSSTALNDVFNDRSRLVSLLKQFAVSPDQGFKAKLCNA